MGWGKAAAEIIITENESETITNRIVTDVRYIQLAKRVRTIRLIRRYNATGKRDNIEKRVA